MMNLKVMQMNMGNVSSRAIRVIPRFLLTIPLSLVIATAQAGSCNSSSSDPDGDGFGWENNQTCIVETLDTAPILYDPAASKQILFTRLQWEWNDLVGSSVVCEEQRLLSSCAQLVPGSSPYWSAQDCSDGRAFGKTVHNFEADGFLLNHYIEGQTIIALGSGQWWINGNGVVRSNLITALDDRYYAELTGKNDEFVIHNVDDAVDGNSMSRFVCSGVVVTDTVDGRHGGICMDFDGDDWGWDGVQSCLTDTNDNNTPICVDTPPVYDGWGWDGSQSCQVTTSTAVCVDSSPRGDGWGWNGISSCRVYSNQ